MHNVYMNVVMAKRCNMWIVFFDFNKYNVIPTVENMDKYGGWFFHKRREWLRGGQGGKRFTGINSNQLSWISLSMGVTYIYVWEYESTIIE